jgi:hypothetical protein
VQLARVNIEKCLVAKKPLSLSRLLPFTYVVLSVLMVVATRPIFKHLAVPINSRHFFVQPFRTHSVTPLRAAMAAAPPIQIIETSLDEPVYTTLVCIWSQFGCDAELSSSSVTYFSNFV